MYSNPSGKKTLTKSKVKARYGTRTFNKSSNKKSRLFLTGYLKLLYALLLPGLLNRLLCSSLFFRGGLFLWRCLFFGYCFLEITFKLFNFLAQLNNFFFV